jgi:hypothetical protein
MKNLFHIGSDMGKFVVLRPYRGLGGGFGYGMTEEAVCFSTSPENCVESFFQGGLLEGDKFAIYQPIEEILVYHPTSEDEPMMGEYEDSGETPPEELRSESPVKVKRIGYIIIGKERGDVDWNHDWTFFKEEKG